MIACVGSALQAIQLAQVTEVRPRSRYPLRARAPTRIFRGVLDEPHEAPQLPRGREDNLLVQGWDGRGIVFATAE